MRIVAVQALSLRVWWVFLECHGRVAFGAKLLFRYSQIHCGHVPFRLLKVAYRAGSLHDGMHGSPADFVSVTRRTLSPFGNGARVLDGRRRHRRQERQQHADKPFLQVPGHVALAEIPQQLKPSLKQDLYAALEALLHPKSECFSSLPDGFSSHCNSPVEAN